MAPPSSGGICLAQMLQMIEPYDIKSMGIIPRGYSIYGRSRTTFYADRAHFGDPDFATIPQDHLLDKSYANERMLNYSLKKQPFLLWFRMVTSS